MAKAHYRRMMHSKRIKHQLKKLVKAKFSRGRATGKWHGVR